MPPGWTLDSVRFLAVCHLTRAGPTVQVFGTFTPDLQRLADWLAVNKADRVAMESTGIYWIPAFEVLEARGFKVYLVNR